MNDATFQKHLWLSSVPLVRLNDQQMPTKFASGCLIDYFGKRVLLTVSHATRDQKNWAIQLRYVPGNGTETFQLGTKGPAQIGVKISFKGVGVTAFS
jgi:hypothetical protein